MKTILAFCMLLTFSITKAQGPQQLVTVPVTSWGGTAKGWLYLPQDYNSTTKKYPVVFFYHGVGEAGTDPNRMLWQGIPQLIAGGMRPDNIINPADGQSYSFIVLSIQAQWWSPDPNWLPYEINWLKQNYRIDTNRLYVTGLSAGGQQVCAAISTPETGKLIAASVPMSPASAISDNGRTVAAYGIETWFLSGSSDGNFTGNAVNSNTTCNNALSGSSKLNLYPGGHCCWNTYYNINWNDPASGLSVWEWMLTNKRQPSDALPVNFLSVDIKKEAGGIKLNWKVADEVNVSKYEVEKSRDGRTYTTIGYVLAGELTQYSFTDASFTSKSFFRIKSVDHDGQYKYSSVVSYNSGKSSVVIKIFPVPAKNEITIQHPLAQGNSRIIVHSADGRALKKVFAMAGSQQTSIDISLLKSGIYYLKHWNEENSVETMQIVKE